MRVTYEIAFESLEFTSIKRVRYDTAAQCRSHRKSKYSVAIGPITLKEGFVVAVADSWNVRRDIALLGWRAETSPGSFIVGLHYTIDAEIPRPCRWNGHLLEMSDAEFGAFRSQVAAWERMNSRFIEDHRSFFNARPWRAVVVGTTADQAADAIDAIWQPGTETV